MKQTKQKGLIKSIYIEKEVWQALREYAYKNYMPCSRAVTKAIKLLLTKNRKDKP